MGSVWCCEDKTSGRDSNVTPALKPYYVQPKDNRPCLGDQDIMNVLLDGSEDSDCSLEDLVLEVLPLPSCHSDALETEDQTNGVRVEG